VKTQRLEAICQKFESAKVAVLGDFFLDLYILCDRRLSELSLETHKETFQAIDLRGQPGTAGVTTNNLRSLGAKAAAIACIGDDGNGYTLRKALEETGVDTNLLITHPDRKTITYTKPMMREVDGSEIELNRIDIINRSRNPEDLTQKLIENTQKAFEESDGLLVVEQVKNDGFGNLSQALRDELAKLSEHDPEKIIMADSRHFAPCYRGISMKMNISEAKTAAVDLNPALSNLESQTPLEAAAQCAETFWKAYQKPVFITLGDQGLAGWCQQGFFHVPGYQIDGPIDPVGAGDATLAGIGLARCCGASPQEAAYIGNLVGSITIQQIGTTGVATQADLLRRHHDYQNQQKNLGSIS
jgi:rfaE bifunctional protein kinase chain/domain